MFYFEPARHGFRAQAENAKEQKPPDGEDQKPREALWPRPRLLIVLSVCFTNTVLFWNQPTGLLSHTTQVAQTDPKLRSLPPSEAQPRLVSLFEDTETKIGGTFQASGVYWGYSPLFEMEWTACGPQSPMGSHRALVRAARSSRSGPAPSAS